MEAVLDALTVVALDPRARGAAILLAALVLARLADWSLTRGVARFVRSTKNDLDDRLLALIHRPAFSTVVLLGLLLVAMTVGLADGPRRLTVRVLGTLLLLVWLAFLVPFVRLVLEALSRRKDRFLAVQERTLPLFDNLAKVVLACTAAYACFLIWDIDITGWLMSAGIVGIAVGFAAKDTLANLFAGVFILADAPYKIGDYILLDTGERGQVTQVGIRSTRLLTRDDIEVTIPNAVMANAKITNESGGPWEKERIRVAVSVAYGSDVDRVREVLMDVARTSEHLHDEPEPRVRFRAFGDSGLAFELLGWIDEPARRGFVLDQLNTSVYKRFADEGIEIPYSKLDVQVRELPAPRSREG